MPFCEHCGTPRPAAGSFCPGCGRPLSAAPGVPAPGTPPTEPLDRPPAPADRPGPAPWPEIRLPGWLTGDWPLVGLCAGLMLAALVAVSAVYGTVVAVAAAGDARALPAGAAVGTHLAFAAFGARTATRVAGEFGAGLSMSFLPLPWAIVGVAVTRGALAFARSRLTPDRPTLLAFAAKLALTFGVALGVAATIVSTGDADVSSGFGSDVDGGEAWFFATVIVAVTGFATLRQAGTRLLPPFPAGLRRTGFVALDGAAAFGLLAGALGLVGYLWAIAVSDGTGERLGLLTGYPALALTVGAVAADVAMGAAAGTASGHASLAHFGFPPDAASGAAPAPLFFALVVAPGLVAATVWRRLERDRPGDEQSSLGAGFTVALGFAGAAWVAALVGRIFLVAFVEGDDGFRDSVGALLVARPNPGTVLGLALLWGVPAGVGAALVWARRRRLAWRLPESGGAQPDAGPGAAPAGPMP